MSFARPPVCFCSSCGRLLLDVRPGMPPGRWLDADPQQRFVLTGSDQPAVELVEAYQLHVCKRDPQ